MKKLLNIIGGIIIAAILVGFGFISGVVYGVEGTSKIACEGLTATMSELDIDETSPELTLSGKNYGECEGMQFVITRTK